MTLFLTLFLAGMVTILLPCILPLVPVVVGVSIADRNPLRPLLTVLGMVVSFVLFTFLLTVLLSRFVALADFIRIATFEVLFLFGISFLTQSREVRGAGGILGGLFFLSKGWIAVAIAAVIGFCLMEAAGRLAGTVQQAGLRAQNKVRTGFGGDTSLTAFFIGMTLGLVWVPCAGPALGFALTLVREQPGPMAAGALTSYALGTAVPLLLVGYGGQAATRTVRSLTRFTGVVKTVSGVLLVATALALQLHLFTRLQVWIAENTMYGDLGTRIEESLFEMSDSSSASSASPASMVLPRLPKIIRAPELSGLGPWHNSDPLTMAGLKGKVVLVDFWTYSCINCIRTLPYLRGYWDKYKGTGKFVLLGVHSPEFTFEKSESNVQMAIKRYGLTYPIAQDNDFATWSAFANRYWPAKYLIDADGYVRYTHFGEGAYDETDRAIATLLEEAGVDTSALGALPDSETARRYGDVSHETYIGSRSWPAFGNRLGEPDAAPHTYTIPDDRDLHRYYLGGTWRLVDQEHQVLESSSGEIRMMFQGGEANLVLGLKDDSKPVQAIVRIDGKETKAFTIDSHDLYPLYKGEGGRHDLSLELSGAGVQAFAFTFGQ
jgi:cytochrome c biogenesis protein CcdA/thiol-disulfide isomerase/thioredoxin